MRELLRLTVPPEADGLALRDFLRRFAGVSRTLLTRLKHQEGITVNGAPRWTVHPVRAGDLVVVCLADAPSDFVAPEPAPLDIAYEDGDVLVVNKPPGLIVHPARGYRRGTLANAVAHHLAAAGQAAPVRPVNRLDLDTSGLVLFAKNPWAHGALGGRLRREYLAVAAGALAATAGAIDAPIRPDPAHTVKREVHQAGQRAVTGFRVLERLRGATLLAVTLETGRTHQIRVHLAHLGHPLVGDALYGGPVDRIGRQALHAAALAFTQPRTRAPVQVTAPLPEDLAALLAALRAPAP